jgi:predicted nucleotide-binding protein
MAHWQIDDVRQILSTNNYTVTSETRTNGCATTLKLASGQTVNCFDKGTVNVQGKNPEPVKALFQNDSARQHISSPGLTTQQNQKVFVVYGHDETSRTQLENLLRRWKLEPVILDQLASEGQTIIEKLEMYTADVSYAVVLATPDDEGHRAGRPDEKKYRARQNVVLELGILFAKLGRRKVAVLIKDQHAMERPSDIHGVVYIPFASDISREAGVQLAKEMSAAGYHINVNNL